MRNRLYGIKKVFLSDKLEIDHPLMCFRDGEYVKDKTIWTELPLVRPGSISYKYEENNSKKCCNVELDFVSKRKITYKEKFFLCEDQRGTKHIVGLGQDYMTEPKVSEEDVIGDNASTGCKITVKITWLNDFGKLFAI